MTEPELPSFLNDFITESFGDQLQPCVNLPGGFERKEEFIISSPICIATENEAEDRAILGQVTIRSQNVKLKNIKIVGTIDIQRLVDGNGSSLTIEDCEIVLPKSVMNHAVKVSQNSSLFVKNCIFHDLERVGIYANRDSSIIVEDSSFINFTQTAINMNQNTKSTILRSSFRNIKRSSIFLAANSESVISECTFAGSGQHTVSINQGAKANITNSKFSNLNHHAIYLHNKGELIADYLEFSNVELSAVYIASSSAAIYHSTFEDLPGNAILSTFSTLTVEFCTFRNLYGPALTLSGYSSETSFKNSKIRNCSTHAFIIKESSAPVFDTLAISKINNYCFSISNLSRAIVRHCVINKCGNAAFCVSNGATPLIESNRILKSSFIESFGFGQPFAIGNIVTADDTMHTDRFVSIHHRGEGKFSDNSLSLLEGSVPFSVYKGKLTLNGDLPASERTMMQSKEEIYDCLERMHAMEHKEFEKMMLEGNTSSIKTIACFKCNGKQSDVYFFPCGHRVLCEDCARDCKECPLCKLPVSTYARKIETEDCNTCTVCHQPSNSICLPCGHTCDCYSCLASVAQNARVCHKCKKPAAAISPLFVLE